MKGETMGRSDLASSVPVAGGNNRWHRVGGETAKTYIDKRTIWWQNDVAETSNRRSGDGSRSCHGSEVQCAACSLRCIDGSSYPGPGLGLRQNDEKS